MRCGKMAAPVGLGLLVTLTVAGCVGINGGVLSGFESPRRSPPPVPPAPDLRIPATPVAANQAPPDIPVVPLPPVPGSPPVVTTQPAPPTPAPPPPPPAVNTAPAPAPNTPPAAARPPQPP